MIKGIVFLLISFVRFYLVKTSNHQNAVIENTTLGKLKLYFGIGILFILGVVSILNEYLQ